MRHVEQKCAITFLSAQT